MSKLFGSGGSGTDERNRELEAKNKEAEANNKRSKNRLAKRKKQKLGIQSLIATGSAGLEDTLG